MFCFLTQCNGIFAIFRTVVANRNRLQLNREIQDILQVFSDGIKHILLSTVLNVGTRIYSHLNLSLVYFLKNPQNSIPVVHK